MNNADTPDRNFIGIAPRFFVTDLPRSIAYYRDALGFNVDTVYGDPISFAMPRRDGIVIMLGPYHDPARVKPNGADGESWDAYIFVRDADALFAEYASSHADIVHPPVDRPFYNAREFAIRDPDGYIIAFAHDLPRE